MGLAIKSGAAWTTIDPGTVRVKWGSGWVYPTKFRTKSGNTWADSGYVSYPNPPRSVAVNAWSYTNVSISWAAPAAGGAPVSTYEIKRTNSDGVTAPSIYVEPSSPSANFPVSQDGKYRFYVRSKSAAGLYSAWVEVGAGGVGIGHPQVISQRWVQKSVQRQWAKYIYLGKDQYDGPTAPAHNTATYGFSVGAYLTNIWLDINTACSSALHGTNRGCNWVVNGDGSYSTPNYALPRNADSTADCWGLSKGPSWSNGGKWGLLIHGAGWGFNEPYTLKGTVTLTGWEYYAQSEDYVSTAAKANYYY